MEQGGLGGKAKGSAISLGPFYITSHPWWLRSWRPNPELTFKLDLTDRPVDLVSEGVDCAVRVGEPADSSPVSIRLAENQRVVAASPQYLASHAEPRTLADALAA